MKKQFFKDQVIVSCGTLSPELNYLRKKGFLNANPEKILEFSDEMGIDIKPYKISMDRFKKLLLMVHGR